MTCQIPAMSFDHLCMSCMAAGADGDVCRYCRAPELEPDASGLFLPPRTIVGGKYLLGRILGHGGFGVTYLGWDLTLERKLAVKEYFPQQFATRAAQGPEVVPYSGEHREHFATGLKKFLAEGRALVRFQEHPGIVSLLDFLEANGTAYLAMEYVEGQTLKAFLSEQPGERLPATAGVAVMMPVLDALRAVHAAGLVHRDVSPDNIYIARGGQVKLLDFGSVKDALREHSQSIDIVIKRGYSPFEQYQKSGKIGPWTDVYAAAATLYRVLTGRTPPDSAERMSQDTLEPPSQLGVVDLPPPAEAALLEALAVSPSNRLGKIDDLQQPLLAMEPDAAAVSIDPPAPPAVPEPPATATETERVSSRVVSRRPEDVTVDASTEHEPEKLPPSPVPEGVLESAYENLVLDRQKLYLAAAALIFLLLVAGASALYDSWTEDPPAKWALTVRTTSPVYATLDRTQVPEGGQKLARTHRFSDLEARTYELKLWRGTGNNIRKIFKEPITIHAEDPKELEIQVPGP